MSFSAWRWLTAITATAGSARCCGVRAGASTTSVWFGSCARTTCFVWRSRCSKPPTTDARHSWRVWPNLARHLMPMAQNQLWVADITYVRLAEAFIYLAIVLDAFSRKVVGWAMADHLRASLALDALEMALTSRDVIAGGLVHHSDRGIQYACGDYIGRLKAAGIQPSMSRAGCPYDNAMAESFMKTLKHEEVDASAYRDLAHARAAIGEFIETAYNHQKLHSALAYLSPVEFETNQSGATPSSPGYDAAELSVICCLTQGFSSVIIVLTEEIKRTFS